MDPEGALLDALTAAAKAPESKREGHTFARAKTLLETLRRWRALSRSLPVYDLLQHIFAETDYLFAVAAMPAGEQRSANVALFLSQADAFGSTRDADLSHFIRQWDVHREQGIDYGEANVLREDADVVRITTIHKSKGLEYPVVFVAGLGRLFNKKDMQAMLLVDGDAGLGCNYFEPETRLRLTTLRREAVAEKMLTDMLGEEMRVLYVAMTRAKDKLYMTASIDKYAQKAERILNRQAGGSARQLSVSALKHATSFSDWVLQALLPSDAPSVKISVVDGATLRLMKEQEQLDMKEALAALTALEKRDGAVPDPGLQKVLEEALESEYGHPELAGLFTKTTVTELKRAQLPTAEEQDEEEKAAKAPWLVAKDADSHMGQNEATPGGAARGTAMHLLLQLLPYARFGDAATCSEDAIGAWIEEVIAAGKLTREETDERMAKELLVFLQSPVGERMAAAERRGELYREQPFVLGLPATEFRPDFPSEETILVQGIIDAFFREDDALVVVDYKTDRIRRESDLAARYEKQLAIFARALEQLLQVPVKERILYSVFLGKEIRT